MSRLDSLAADILDRATGTDRFILGIAGPPGAGKSTFAEALLAAMEARSPGTTTLVPMDGYHFDNAILMERGLLPRKGAPETFNVDGLAQDLDRIRSGTADVVVPVFDRDNDLARANARVVSKDRRIILVEGNYLLLAAEPWSGLERFFDRTLMLRVDESTLRERLVDRWLSHGLAAEAAVRRAEDNDLVNARVVITGSRKANIDWDSSRPYT